jgi:branched-chain amino acid aminotransferase
MADLLLWSDGAMVSAEAARCHPLANALHYGTGVFEGIRAYQTPRGPAVFRLHEHLERMRQGADLIGMDFHPEPTARAVCETLRANQLGDAYIRPLAFYETGGIGLDTAPLGARTLVAAMPWRSHLPEGATLAGISLRTSSWRRNAARAIPPLKLCGGYVNSVIAKREAALHGCDEALFIDDHENVCECTGENVFFVEGGTLYTVEHPDALPGITRRTLIELTGATPVTTPLARLREADEIFVTGTSAEVTPVTRFDGRDLAVGPRTREIATLYASIVRGGDEARGPWLTYLHD